MARVVLIIAGGGMLLFGLWGVADPVGMWTSFGLAVPGDSPIVRTELRAFYGGLEIGVGAALLWHLAPERRGNGLVLSTIIYAAIGSARALGLLVDGGASTFQLGALVTEIGIALWSIIALRARAGR